MKWCGPQAPGPRIAVEEAGEGPAFDEKYPFFVWKIDFFAPGGVVPGPGRVESRGGGARVDWNVAHRRCKRQSSRRAP